LKRTERFRRRKTTHPKLEKSFDLAPQKYGQRRAYIYPVYAQRAVKKLPEQ